MKSKLIILASTLTMAVALTFGGVAHAATVNYNNIIDDMVFDNKNTMNASQIDAFLNTFPNSCISVSNGFSAPDVTSYSPSASFQYGGLVSAGTIIYHASQAYGINPQVLLTTLQKEQGLVKGDGSNIIRSGPDNKNCGALAISASLGYNCPDSMHLSNYSGFTLYAYRGTPVTSVNQTCVESASYVGFSRQVIIAAWQFTFDRHRSEGQNNWYVNTPGWDNSDDLSFCYSQRAVVGGPYYLCPDQASHATDPYIKHSGQYTIDDIVVTIQNGATAALYNYTPHKHGQQLFTDIFTGWFGLPYGNDTLITHPNGTLVSFGGTVYLIGSNSLQPLTAAAFSLYNFSWSEIKPASSGDMALPTGALLSVVPSGTLFTTGDGTVYVANSVGGAVQKQWISAASFASLHYSWAQIITLPPSAIPATTIPGYYSTSRHPTGTLIKMNSSVYSLDETSRHYVSLLAFTTNGYRWGDIVDATPADTAVPEGTADNIRQGSMLYAGGNIYVVDSDAGGVFKRPVGPWECYANRLHYTSADWFVTSTSALPPRTGGLFTC